LELGAKETEIGDKDGDVQGETELAGVTLWVLGAVDAGEAGTFLRLLLNPGDTIGVEPGDGDSGLITGGSMLTLILQTCEKN